MVLTKVHQRPEPLFVPIEVNTLQVDGLLMFVSSFVDVVTVAIFPERDSGAATW